ncbi:MAG: hypothetical protein IPG79_04440 [Saprospiraceae bacterium]|nr:hypothetical protein [Saprospiraceae bacterium]
MNGSLSSYPKNPAVTVGDVSAILLSKSPMVGRPFFTPNFEIALLSDWEEKLEKIADHCIKEDVVNFAGVPTWTIVLFNKILEKTGKKICWRSGQILRHIFTEVSISNLI